MSALAVEPVVYEKHFVGVSFCDGTSGTYRYDDATQAVKNYALRLISLVAGSDFLFPYKVVGEGYNRKRHLRLVTYFSVVGADVKNHIDSGVQECECRRKK